MEKTYKARVHCSNCDYNHKYFEVDVLKGISVSEFCKEFICPKCGCKGTVFNLKDLMGNGYENEIITLIK